MAWKAFCKSPEAAGLTFRRYGDEHFFAEAWMPGNDGLAAPTTRRERGRTELAGNQPQIVRVSLRAR